MKYLSLFSLSLLAGTSVVSANYNLGDVLQGDADEARASLARRVEKLQGEPHKDDIKADLRFQEARQEKVRALALAQAALEAIGPDADQMKFDAVALYNNARRKVFEVQLETDVAMLPETSKKPQDWVRGETPTEDELAYNNAHGKIYHQVTVLPDPARAILEEIKDQVAEVHGFFDWGDSPIMSALFLMNPETDFEAPDNQSMFLLKNLPVDKWKQSIRERIAASERELEDVVPGFKEKALELLSVYDLLEPLKAMSEDWKKFLLRRQADLDSPEASYEGEQQGFAARFEELKNVLEYLPRRDMRSLCFSLVPNFIVPPTIAPGEVEVEKPTSRESTIDAYFARKKEKKLEQIAALNEKVGRETAAAADAERKRVEGGHSRGGESVMTYANHVAKPLYHELIDATQLYFGVKESDFRFKSVDEIEGFYKTLEKEGILKFEGEDKDAMATALRRAEMVGYHGTMGFNPKNLLLYTFHLLQTIYNRAENKEFEALKNLMFVSFYKLVEQNGSCATGLAGRAFEICAGLLNYLPEEEKEKERRRLEVAAAAEKMSHAVKNLKSLPMGRIKIILPRPLEEVVEKAGGAAACAAGVGGVEVARDGMDGTTIPVGFSAQEFRVDELGEKTHLTAQKGKINRLWFYKEAQGPVEEGKGFTAQPWGVKEGDEVTFSFDITADSFKGFGTAFVSNAGKAFVERPIGKYGEQQITLTIPKGVVGVTPIIYANFTTTVEDLSFTLKSVSMKIRASE